MSELKVVSGRTDSAIDVGYICCLHCILSFRVWE